MNSWSRHWFDGSPQGLLRVSGGRGHRLLPAHRGTARARAQRLAGSGGGVGRVRVVRSWQRWHDRGRHDRRRRVEGIGGANGGGRGERRGAARPARCGVARPDFSPPPARPGSRAAAAGRRAAGRQLCAGLLDHRGAGLAGQRALRLADPGRHPPPRRESSRSSGQPGTTVFATNDGTNGMAILPDGDLAARSHSTARCAGSPCQSQRA